MEKYRCIIIVMLVILCGCVHSSDNHNSFGEEIEYISEINEQEEAWKEAYQTFLNDWTVIEQYADLEYLKMYFKEEYGFDTYWLCDVDENEIPELFLHSTSMNLTALIIYSEEPIFLFYDAIYGINQETNEVVIRGHWHGAGGTGYNEWKAYQILGNSAKESMSIDCYDFDEPYQYIIYDPQTDNYKYWRVSEEEAAIEYKELYTAHVEPCVLLEDYQIFNLDDLNGLECIQ